MRRWMNLALLGCALTATGLYATASWIGAGWLLMPPRKPLSPAHREILAHPGTSGLCILRGMTASGVPYLLCLPDAVGRPGTRGQTLRQQLTASGLPPRPYGELLGTVVLLHGWGMRKEDLLPTAERFCAAGLRCVIPDLPGHGENPTLCTRFGASPYEQKLPGAVLDDAAKRFRFSSKPAVLWGLSMGGAYELQSSIAQPELWRALVVVSSFDALDGVIRGEIDRRLPRGMSAFLDPGLATAVRWRGGFWLNDIRPVDHARQLKLPVLFVHGTADDLIPLSRGKSLFQAVSHPRKRWLVVTDARHGNVLGTPQHVFVEIATWMVHWSGPPGER